MSRENLSILRVCQNIKFLMDVKIDIVNKNSFTLPVNRNNYPSKKIERIKKIKITPSRNKYFKHFTEHIILSYPNTHTQTILHKLDQKYKASLKCLFCSFS